MNYLAAFLWIFGFLRLAVAASNLLLRQWLRSGTPAAPARVSILIPARDEADKLDDLLRSIVAMDYPDWEVIVYDDMSTDATADIITDMGSVEKRIGLVRGEVLPGGWTGKNHACHQLAKHATGDYMLFLDADVVLGPHVLRDALAHMNKHKLDLLSVFPKQVMPGLGEKVSVPLMNWILLSTLPLILTKNSRRTSLVAANGQFMLFPADLYRQKQFHLAVKDRPTEDMAIARYMKRERLRVHTILGSDQVRCRMYHSLPEAISGFSKNILSIFGERPAFAVAYALITSFGFIPVWMAAGPLALAGYGGLILLIRALTSMASKQSVPHNLLLAPVQQSLFVAIIMKALYHKFSRKGIAWKGRLVDN